MKLTILIPKNYYQVYEILQVCLSVIIEHIIFISTIFILLKLTVLSNLFTSNSYKLLVLLYLSLTLPELFKLIAIILQTWDTDPFLLFLVSILIISIQYHAFSIILLNYYSNLPSFNRMILSYFSWKVILCFTLSYVMKLIFRRLVYYNIHDIYYLGILL